ncbi:MAG: hypothetical protein HYY40_11135 [Bacteroidetes bacterium]|nr:hypothetical protein [Bacteroidota bacterium]
MNDKFLTFGRGIEKWKENFVAFADYLHQELATFDFGDLCFEFKAKNLLAKNEIYPYDFQVTDNKFVDKEGNLLYGMWECEWVSKKIIFDFNDVNCFIISKKVKEYLNNKELSILFNLLNENSISFKIIDFDKLPKSSNQFFVERYLKRIQP